MGCKNKRGWELRETQGGYPMLVQFTVTVDGREVGSECGEVSGSAAEMEEQIRRMGQRVGRMALEPALTQIAAETRAPRCCGRAMESRGWRVSIRSRRVPSA